MKTDSVCGVIPARGGSQGIPSKNLRNLGGKPLIHYISEAALAAQLVDFALISTDSEAIAREARELGVEALLHAPELSHDDVSSFVVVQNALRYLVENGLSPSVLVTLRPTSPLCLPMDIDGTVETLSCDDSADAAISVCRSPIHPERVLRITSEGKLAPYGRTRERFAPVQRQAFEQVYIRNGAVYASRVETIRRGGLWGQNNLPYIMPPERSVNINEEIDFVLADALLQE